MYGLVLEGGGARGSYHMGVYKAILEEGIDIKGVAGTSIGALNGALIVQGDYELGLKLWNEISYTDIIEANEQEIERVLQSKPNIDDLKYLSKKAFSLISDRGFDIKPFKEMLKENIDEEKIRNSDMEFGIVTINLTDHVPLEVFVEDIPEGSLTDFLLASSYLPIFKAERLGGKLYLDGGFYDNLPFKLLQKKGYQKLILVRTHAKGLIRKPPVEDDDITIISPSRDIGKSYICDPDKAKENIDMGYYDALKVFRDLKGDFYYIEPEDEEYYTQLLLKLNNNKIKRISEQLNLTLDANKRTLFENIIPKIGSYLGLKEDFTYEELMVSLLEKKAKQLEVKEYALYSFKDLLKAVKSIGPFEDDNIEHSNSIGRLIDKVDLGKFFNKDETIIEIANIIFVEDNM